MHIDGIGITDLLHKDKIDLLSIVINSPVIEVIHQLQPYNKKKLEETDTLSLYRRFMNQLKSIAIKKIDIEHATVIDQVITTKKKVTKFKDIFIRMNDIRIDSCTQFDKSRFLFAKHALLGLSNFSLRTPDSLYLFKAGNISISGEQHAVTLLNTELMPRYGREEFEKRLSTRRELFHISIPRITLTDIDWWAMINKEKILVKEAAIFDGNINAFFDLSLPRRSIINIKNFPHQMLMKLPLMLLVKKLDVHRFKISYEEYHPDIKKSGFLTLDNIKGIITNTSNIPLEIKKQPIAVFSGSCRFMKQVPLSLKLQFDLSKSSTGAFTADLNIAAMEKESINPIAGPMGLFTLKSGHFQEGKAHVEGDNLLAKGKVAMYYSDLSITPLKEQFDEHGKLKKKHLTGFIANTFLIKKSNPEHGQFREPDFSVYRDHHANFFNFVWMAVMTGILKTVGIPSRFVIK